MAAPETRLWAAELGGDIPYARAPAMRSPQVEDSWEVARLVHLRTGMFMVGCTSCTLRLNRHQTAMDPLPSLAMRS